MARISFEEFSSGLPVKRAGENIPTPQNGKVDDVEPVSEEPGLQSRLATVGGDVSDTIGSALQGTGEFAGQTPLRRGVTATAAGFSTVPRGALALAPAPVRKGIEFAGEKIGQGFSALTGLIGSNKQLQDWVASNPEAARTIEEVAGTAAPAGEIAGTILGAKPLVPGIPDAPRMSGNVPVQQFDTQPQPIKITNGVQANEKILSEFGPAPTISGISSTIQGIGQQATDFGRRTVREAQETAERNQRLSSLPEPEANVRRNVADERVIDLVETMTPAEIAVTNRLIDQSKLKQGDITTNTAHPKQIVGEELLKPVQAIIDNRRKVGEQLGTIRQQLSGQKNINTNSAFRDFHTFLKDRYQVEFGTDKNIIPGSGTLARGDVPEIQKLYDELRRKTFASEKEIDQFLQRSLKDYDLKQSREQTFSDEVSTIAEQARRSMRQLLPDQYNALSTEYATLSKPLADMVKLLGYKGSLDELTAKDLKAGEVGLRVLGNAADRPQSVIDAVVAAARNSGYTSDVNLNNMIAFADQLDGLYDITPTRSFAGQTTRGVEGSNAIGAMGDAATMNIGGLYNRAMQSRATQQEIQNALENYIRSKSSVTPPNE